MQTCSNILTVFVIAIILAVIAVAAWFIFYAAPGIGDVALSAVVYEPSELDELGRRLHSSVDKAASCDAEEFDLGLYLEWVNQQFAVLAGIEFDRRDSRLDTITVQEVNEFLDEANAEIDRIEGIC